MTADTSVVLASASPRRRDLLAALGLRFRVVPANIDEAAAAAGEPAAAVAVVASAKTRAVSARHPEAVVIGADTIVVLDGAVLGKPRDTAEACRMLMALRDRVHTVFTAVCVRSVHEELSGVVRSMVRMRDYATDELERYVATGSGLDKAGGYGVQDAAFQPVASIEGCYCNVMGLPLWTVIRFLERTGVVRVRRPAEVFAQCTECPLAG